MKRKIIAFLGAVMLGAWAMNLGLVAGSASAACAEPKMFGLSPWYSGLVDGDCNMKPELFSENNLPNTVVLIALNVLGDLMFVVGILAVVYGIYAGFLMITSSGDVGKTEKAKKTLTRAIIGLAIAILSSTIVGVVKLLVYK